VVSARKAQRDSSAIIDAAPVASLAHEINNPLDSLQNLLFLIESEASFTPKGREYLSLANEELHRLSEITHGAMNASRVSANAQNTDIPKLLRSVVEFYASRFAAHSISISPRYCLPEQLLVHRGSVRQMFSNVLLNGADAMPDGGRIHVRIRKAHEWRGLLRKGLRVTFADNGVGIAPDDLPRITQPFFTTKGSSGTGLGLALVKDTVKKHSGTLQVRSSTRPSRSGSVFAIFLPAT
jgi:two-component system NtrC family sensor kinase